VREALILTYHAVEPGPPPLCVDPDLFREHVDSLVDSGARSLTLSELAAAAGRDDIPERAVAITFDDGCASVARFAAPLLAERGLRATVFCVSGHLGGLTDWSTQPASVPVFELATAAEVEELAGMGIEIGSHGVEHFPLAFASEQRARDELLASKDALEQVVRAPVRSFAYPYGSPPSPPARALVRDAYSAACGTSLGIMRGDSDILSLPRIDVHYPRRPELLRGAVAGRFRAYLRGRALGARARRMLKSDYEPPRSTPSPSLEPR
jgi:peptidoglycan/xylan/chitin deacetylase (PgdA/CDA1 family)